MADVWRHSPNTEEIRKTAICNNISDFDSEKLIYLVRRFKTLFASSPGTDLTFKVIDPEIVISLQVSENLTWKFDLKKCLESEKAVFFAHFCLLSFSASAFLQLKAAKLEEVIAIQQKYALYLEENYKTVNGTELMDKYKRQHPDDAKYLLEFESSLFDTICRNEYMDQSLQQGSKTWTKIKSVLNDKSWMEEKSSVGKEDVKKETYSVIDRISAPMPIGAINHKRPKLEEDDGEPRKKIKKEESDNLPSSPTKPRSSSPIRLDGSSPRRRRIGRIGRK